jgi:hypothetical protein
LIAEINLQIEPVARCRQTEAAHQGGFFDPDERYREMDLGRWTAWRLDKVLHLTLELSRQQFETITDDLANGVDSRTKYMLIRNATLAETITAFECSKSQ